MHNVQIRAMVSMQRRADVQLAAAAASSSQDRPSLQKRLSSTCTIHTNCATCTTWGPGPLDKGAQGPQPGKLTHPSSARFLATGYVRCSASTGSTDWAKKDIKLNEDNKTTLVIVRTHSFSKYPSYWWRQINVKIWQKFDDKSVLILEICGQCI